MPAYPDDPPEWRTFSGSYQDQEPVEQGFPSVPWSHMIGVRNETRSVAALTAENERLRAELAGVREELAVVTRRGGESGRLTHYEWLGRSLALPRRQHRGIMRWIVERICGVLAGAKQKFIDTLGGWVRG